MSACPICETGNGDEERFKMFFEDAPLPCQSLDPNGFILDVNKAWVDLLGYEKESAVGKRFDSFLYPDWRSLFKKNFLKLKSTGELRGVEFEMAKRRGGTVTVKLNGKIERDRHGNMVRTFCVLQDITEQIPSQSKSKEPEMISLQDQKMQSVETLAGGVAHQINNILAIVLGHAEFAMEDIPRSHPAQKYLETILDACLRGTGFVDQLLDWSRDSLEKHENVNLAETVKMALKSLRPKIPGEIPIRVNIPEDDFTILGDPDQLCKAIFNLCKNAAEAMKENPGSIEVGLEKTEISNPNSDAHRSVSGKYIKLTVKDNGPGISTENIDRIFDPFFTTKRSGEGTGMGLAVVKSIVKSHKGFIEVQSQPGMGARFDVFFPMISWTGKDV